MAPISPLKIARSIFDSYVEIFERSGDPAAAWGAFYLARRHGFDAPAAINAEVDRFAGAIEFAAFRLLSNLGSTAGDVSFDNKTVGKSGRASKTAMPVALFFGPIDLTSSRLRWRVFASAACPKTRPSQKSRRTTAPIKQRCGMRSKSIPTLATWLLTSLVSPSTPDSNKVGVLKWGYRTRPPR